MASLRSGRYLETFLEPVAPSWLNMSPWRGAAPPITPETISTNMQNMCEHYRDPRNLTHNPSKRSIDLKNPTNALRKVSVFDIRLSQ